MDQANSDSDRPTEPMEPGSQPISARQFPTLPGYEIQELVGRGGQATVYKARHKELKRTVAFKRPAPAAAASVGF